MDYEYQYSNRITLPWVIMNLKSYLFPDLSKKQDRFEKQLCGVIASLDKKPVGLILSSFGQSKKEARVHSFVVHPDHRNKGVGKNLLSELERNLFSEGCAQVDGTYRDHWKSSEALNAVLTQNGWAARTKDLIIVRGEAEKVLKLFMDSQLRLPDGFHVMPFTEISLAQKEVILSKKKASDWYPDILNPFTYIETINPVTSLALIHEGQVKGWVISHLIAPELNEFTSLFVDPGLRSYKLAHLMMRETIHRQFDAGVKNFLITSKTDNYVMSRFLIRHAPHTGVFFTTTYYSSKDLTKS
ncbi:MAG: hypothetical protein DRI69_04130 [Bacteroidetes bacterium]|nr:MAG: hypothetical protein DRI69_04130 [Bacteroidota bacterium]